MYITGWLASVSSRLPASLECTAWMCALSLTSRTNRIFSVSLTSDKVVVLHAASRSQDTYKYSSNQGRQQKVRDLGPAPGSSKNRKAYTFPDIRAENRAAEIYCYFDFMHSRGGLHPAVSHLLLLQLPQTELARQVHADLLFHRPLGVLRAGSQHGGEQRQGAQQREPAGGHPRIPRIKRPLLPGLQNGRRDPPRGVRIGAYYDTNLHGYYRAALAQADTYWYVVWGGIKAPLL